jgi:hypothetical protein
MNYNASYKEYIFSKNFSNCVSVFNKFFESEVRVIDEYNLDPYTECIFIFIQNGSMNDNSNIVNPSYKLIDPVAHSYAQVTKCDNKTKTDVGTSNSNEGYNFCESIRIKIEDRLMDIVQKKLGLYKIYESKISTTKKIKTINKSVIDILNNYLQAYGNDVYVKNLLTLCVNSDKIDNAEEIQKELIEVTKAVLHNTVNKLYDFYCKVRLLEPIAMNEKQDTLRIELIVSSSKDFYTLRYVVNSDVVDTINFNIHATRIERLRTLYKKNNKGNYNENHFLDCLYACIRRYRTIFWQHHVFFGNSMPPKTFELWIDYAKSIKGTRNNDCDKDGMEVMECFADPFNCYLDKYYSPFPDVDKPFGSIGSFFSNPPTSGIAIAHPPTEKYFLLEATKTIFSTIHKSKNNIMFIVGLPVWKEYMKTDAIKLVETYPSIGINTTSLVLSNSDLSTHVNSKKTYYYKYKLYILSNYNANIDLHKYSKTYTNIFVNYAL